MTHLFQPKTKARPVKKDVTTEPSVETTTKAGETDTNKQTTEESDDTKPSSETLIRQEIEESKDDGEATAALTAESKPENVVEQIKRSTRRKGKKEKRHSSGKKADNQSSASEVPDIGKLKITPQQ